MASLCSKIIFFENIAKKSRTGVKLIIKYRLEGIMQNYGMITLNKN